MTATVEVPVWEGRHIFGNRRGHPHCVFCGMWRSDNNLPDRCNGPKSAAAPASPVGEKWIDELATPISDALLDVVDFDRAMQVHGEIVAAIRAALAAEPK